MTECERLIENGTFAPDFFKEEIRCDFLVTTERKKVWAVELDLLAQFDRVCKKHNLTYWLLGGSVIGAVRHKGLIPWDDDIDVIMPRSEYERIKLLKSEFTCPYFLQIPGEDGEYFCTFAKLRNSRTTCLSKTLAHADFNHGIALDIMVLDTINPESGGSEFERIDCLARQLSAFMRYSKPNPTEADLRRIAKFPNVNPRATLNEINDIATRHKSEDSSFVGEMTCTVYSFERQKWCKEWFIGSVARPFEGREYPVPVGFDPYLRTEFGDYMRFPPMEQRGNEHSDFIFDADTPYLETVKKFREGGLNHA